MRKSDPTVQKVGCVNPALPFEDIIPKDNFRCDREPSVVLDSVHSLRSQASVIRLRLAALTMVFKVLLLLVSLGVIAYAYAMDERDLAVYGVFGLLGGLVLVLVSWALASRANCPLCQMPVMVNKRCAKHSKARTAFGSHRVRVALAILFTNSFHCPYCMEATAVRVHSRRRIHGNRGAGMRP